MRLSDVLRPGKAGRERYARLRERDAAEQEAEINKEFATYGGRSRTFLIEAARYSLPLERIARLGLEHGYRFVYTTYWAVGSKRPTEHHFELIDEKIAARDEKERAWGADKQKSYAHVYLEGTSYLPTLLLDANRYTISTDEMDRVAMRRGYRYARTTEPVMGCSWHVFEWVERS